MAQGQPKPPLQGYIMFEDPMVGDICKNTFGDGIGLTYEQAALVTSDDIMGLFEGNLDITLFRELKYFTGLDYIPEYCFSCCESLEVIELPESVESIGCYAFESCINLESITLPSNLIAIEESAFSDCMSLLSPKIPEGMLIIGDYAFNGCISIESVALPDTIEAIMDGAFASCANLHSVSFPRNDKFDSIQNYAFTCCGLTRLDIPASVKYIFSCAFDANENLTQVRFEEGSKLNLIDSEAFFDSLAAEGSWMHIDFELNGDFDSIPTIGENVFGDDYGENPIIYVGKGENFGEDLDKIMLLRSKSGAFWSRYNLAPWYDHEHN